MKKKDTILAKSRRNGAIPLATHLAKVAEICRITAAYRNMDTTIAYKGAILHDIGKVSPLFQQTLKEGYQRPPGFIFRHEIASLFFLSLLEETEKPAIIDMIVAHHKSTYEGEEGATGILDLHEQSTGFIETHLTGFEQWSKEAIAILHQFGFPNKTITPGEARANIQQVIQHCSKKNNGWSLWKGILTSADHMASALEKTGIPTPPLFIPPGINKYHTMKSELYPFSLITSNDPRPHTIVIGPTSSGKTNFLMRRCPGRTFYTLPNQASINAMSCRFHKDFEGTGTDIRTLHASSFINHETGEDTILQRHTGASIKIQTPHQLIPLVSGTKGYETLITDLMECDIILDEIHTYSGLMQAVVIKLVEILVHLKCRIHIGTATMPTALYNTLLQKLGGKKNVYEVKLPEETLDTFNRHIIHKKETFESTTPIIQQAINDKQKTLIVCNQVRQAQTTYTTLKKQYPHIKIMLIHSRFKRQDRAALEQKLMTEFQHSTEPCIVVSTQVIEVSLDISFDLMITQCAPIDALIQRFGRIYRFRHEWKNGKYKHIYIIRPSASDEKLRPYNPGIVRKTYNILPGGELLREKNIQGMIDKIYTQCHPAELNLNTTFHNKKWKLKELQHKKKSALLHALGIDSASCITADDIEKYIEGDHTERMQLEIPIPPTYRGIKNTPQIEYGSHPYIIDTKTYNKEIGL